MTTLTRVPAASLRDCRRQTFYRRTGEPRTNEQDRAFLDAARMMAGATVNVITNIMADDGWKFTNHNILFSSDDFIEGAHVTETAHVIGSHPDWTQDRNTVIRVQARTASSIRNTLRTNIITARPAMLARLAFLHQRANTEGYTDPEAPAVLATLNYDTNKVSIDLLFPHQSESVNDETLMWVGDQRSQEIPNPDYPADSHECRRCPWLNACHGAPEDDDEFPDIPEELYENLEAACDEYAAAHRVTREHAAAEKRRTKARDAIKALMGDANLTSFSHEGEASVAVTITPTSPTQIDYDELKRVLTPSQYTAIVTVGKSDRINIKVA